MVLRKLSFVFAVYLLAVFGATAAGVLKYLPNNPKLDGSVDYRAEIQKALNENEIVELKGSGEPKKPFIYGVKIYSGNNAGLVIPEGHVLKGSKSAVIKRIPSKGSVIVTKRGAAVKKIIINGNKKAHWPEFKALGKSDMGILIGSDSLIEDCYIYDIPGCAFGTYANRSIIRRCKAKNSGYIDVKFKTDYYQGKWDKWSGDSFYIRGNNNIVIDCDSEDAFRWDYTTCHSNAGGSVFINCKGRDVFWRSYGFIDIEGCDGDGSIMIDCKSPDGSIAISTSGTKLINCTGQRINVYSTDNVLVNGCETFGGGLAVGGWCSQKNSYVRGGANPVVVNNIINRNSPGPGVPETSDWSLSVFSTDGKGVAAGNILNEYKGRLGRGPGMKFSKVETCGNKKQYKNYKVQKDPKAVKAKQEMLASQVSNRLREFGMKVPALAKKLDVKGKIVVTKILKPQALFIKDESNVGEKERWFEAGKIPAAAKPMLAGQHWDNAIGKYHNYGWYFLKFPLDMDDQHICDTFYLLFGGVDSECKVWLNGKYIGSHKGWKDPFKLKVPFKLVNWSEKADSNILAIRVYTPAGMGGVYGNIAAIMTKAK